MRFEALRSAQSAYVPSASSMSLWSVTSRSSIVGQQSQESWVCQVLGRADHRFLRFPEEARSSHLSAHALRTGALPPLRAQSVRFPFDRPAVPSSCRAPSFFRAGVAPVAPSGSASHSHIYCALWLVHSLLDFESRFERIFTKLDVLWSLS